MCKYIMCNTSSAYNMQHVMILAMWYEGTAQLLNLTERKSHQGGEETVVPGENS